MAGRSYILAASPPSKEVAMPRIAIVQRAPVLLDRAATLQRVAESTAEAAAAGARLVVFPECFVPGYPAWIWRTAAGTDGALMSRLHAQLLGQALDVNAGDAGELQRIAREHSVTLVIGANERDQQRGGGTLYNTVLVIGPDGELLNRHRKLMPTNPERMVHGQGDGAGLRVVDTPVGRIGTLICWENYMPLARTALYAQGIELYIAPTYDQGDGWLATLRHIALEGRCWVLGSGTALRRADIPENLPGRSQLYGEGPEWINEGDSAVFDPQGKLVAGPMRRETGILYAEVDARSVAPARRAFDVCGHYARSDVFSLQVRRTPAEPATFLDAPAAASVSMQQGVE
jgi:nitrilase